MPERSGRAVQTDFLPYLVFGCAEDAGILGELLSHQNMGIIDKAGGVLLHHSGGLHNKSFLAFRLGGRSQPLFLFSRGFVFLCSLWHYYIIRSQRVWNINIPSKKTDKRKMQPRDGAASCSVKGAGGGWYEVLQSGVHARLSIGFWRLRN